MRWLGRLLDLLVAGLTELLLRLERRLGSAPALRILTFDGYGTPDALLVRGRVLQDGRRDHGLLHRAVRRLHRDQVPRARVIVRAGEHRRALRTDEEGYFQMELRPPAEPDRAQGWISVEVALADGAEPAHRSARDVRARAAVLIPPQKVRTGILTDLDQTLLRSRADRRLAMARTVLLRDAGEREVAPGAAALCRALAAGPAGEEGVWPRPVFYHSTEPWTVHEHLRRTLREHGFPRGPLLLRQYNAESILGGNQLQHKRRAVADVVRRFPALRWVLLGDALAEDARVYLELVTAHPDRIESVYLLRSAEPERDAHALTLLQEMRVKGAPEARLVGSHAELADRLAARGLVAADTPVRVRAAGSPRSP